jgi:formate hydrogenlyase transcriptional activator
MSTNSDIKQANTATGVQRLPLEERALPIPGRPQAAPGARAAELTRANLRLTQEINEHRRAEGSLQDAYAKVKRWKDRLQAENVYLQQEVAQEYNFGLIVGQSGAIQRVIARVEQVADLPACLLLVGEPGTGKGVVARAVHNLGPRKDRPMITVNLATLPANLVESELFGWERGEFTGAESRQMGRFELADAGTIFLEEIGALPLELQAKLVRLIRDGEIARLGSPLAVKIDVRVIAASCQDLEQEVLAGRFREDLYRLLKVFTIVIPPLRERREDIPPLIEHFLAKYNGKIGTRLPAVSSGTLDALAAYHWPGNVRELESVVAREVTTGRESAPRLPLGAAQVSPTQAGAALDGIKAPAQREGRKTRSGPERTTATPAPQGIKALAELEHDHILQVLLLTGWRIEGEHGAAGILGVNPSTLRARMRKYGILRPYLPAA